MVKTGFDEYLEGKLTDPEFAEGYNKARKEIGMDMKLEEISKTSGKVLTVLCKFDLAYPGWECDSEGWVVEDEYKERFIVLTNHGGPYFAEREELLNQINSYHSLIVQTFNALNMFDGK